MSVFKTAFKDYSVKFIPFFKHRLAVATTQNFDKHDNGCLHILDLSPTPSSPNSPSSMPPTASTTSPDPNPTTTSSSTPLPTAPSNCTAPLSPQQDPYHPLSGHTNEAYSVDWSPIRSNSIISISFDHTIKLWTIDRPTSVSTFKGQDYCVYNVSWNPLLANVFASASRDYTVRCCDVRNSRFTMTILASSNNREISSCDWNTFDDCLLATGAIDNMVRVWDVRSIRTLIGVLVGHKYAVMKVKFLPHRQNMVMSLSLDRKVCIWDFTVEDALIEKYDRHTHYPAGIDMSVLDEGLLASNGWDGMT
ncbi:peroxisome biogenesis protein 7-like [Chenopodium quinoa]|uniref:peroxisome biogenesis protein 7-like n=1 Tax=Chenopodium quinoa TaxID=63459 RepID=UPI000B77FD5E|nr:peroxisome biogenesis protein 7-like [Chenopodium quinoa]